MPHRNQLEGRFFTKTLDLTVDLLCLLFISLCSAGDTDVRGFLCCLPRSFTQTREEDPGGGQPHRRRGKSSRLPYVNVD